MNRELKKGIFVIFTLFYLINNNNNNSKGEFGVREMEV